MGVHLYNMLEHGLCVPTWAPPSLLPSVSGVWQPRTYQNCPSALLDMMLLMPCPARWLHTTWLIPPCQMVMDVLT